MTVVDRVNELSFPSSEKPHPQLGPLVAVLACLIVLGACAEDDRSVEFTVRDEGVVFWVATEPAVSIGLREGAALYLLLRVRAAGFLPEGRIFVSNGGSREIRLYDPEGRFLGSAGGAGDGPGEFTDLGTAGSYRGDSLFAYD